MKLINNRFTFATIGIISGHPRYDKQTARIIDVLKQQSKEPLEFVGVIGNEYANKLAYTYESSKVLAHEEIVINRNYVEQFQDWFVNPYRSLTHFKNMLLRKTLAEKGLYENLLDKRAPALIIVGNYGLMRRVFSDLNKVYEQRKTVKPLRLGFDELIAYRSVGNEQFIDFMYYNLPKTPENHSKYIFPSMCIGYEGLFKAFQFLQKQQPLSGKDSFYMRDFSFEVSELVKKARSTYRKSHGFNEDQHLILLAPGETMKEAKFSISKFANSLKLFIEKTEIKSVDKAHFKILVLLPQDKKVADYIKSKAPGMSSNYQVSFVEGKDKYGAMCASDYGVLHNGEVTVEAAACQLPSVVINSMSNYRAYVSYLYNGHESPLNVSTNFEGYQQLNGSWTAIGEKMSELMLDNFNRPKLRFYYAKLYRQEIQKMLKMNGRNPEMSVSRTGLQIAADDILRKIQLREQLNTDAPISKFERKQKLQLY